MSPFQASPGPERLDLARHVARDGPPLRRLDRCAQHDRGCDFGEVGAGEPAVADLAGRLLERLSLLELDLGGPHFDERAERLALDGGRHLRLCRHAEALHGAARGVARRRAVAQAQRRAQLGDLVGGAVARGIGLGKAARAGGRVAPDEVVERLARDLAHDQRHRLRSQFLYRALRHDLDLGPLHRGDQGGGPLHRLGQEVCSQRQRQTFGGAEVHQPLRQAAAELEDAAAAPEIGRRRRARRPSRWACRRPLASSRLEAMCDSLCDTMCDTEEL